MEARGQATCHRYPINPSIEGGWNVRDFPWVFVRSLTQNLGFDEPSVS